MKGGNHNSIKYRRGGSTLEILIAFAVLILSITAVIMVSFGNQSNSVDTETNNEALYMAQGMLEEARANSRFDFNLVNPITTTETRGALTYTKILSVGQIDLFTKQATSTVAWQVGSRTLKIFLPTLLTNPQAVSGGDTCSSVLSGDWAHPQLTSYEFGKDLLVPSDPSSGFPIGDIDVNNHVLYVVVNNSNGNNDPTFFKFDVSNPSVMPVFISSMDNATVKPGFNAVVVAGSYAYLANAYGANFDTCVEGTKCSQLQVIDTNSMTVVGMLKIPGVNGNGGQAIGTAIFHKNGIIYLGLAKTDSGPEFNIIDVGGGGSGGGPANPVYIGGLDIGNGVNSIYVKDDYAYVASPNDEELKVINISNPSSPSQVGQFNAPGGGVPVYGHGKSLSLVGNVLYLGRTLLSGNEFYILNKTNPETNLPTLGSRDIQNSSSNNTSVNGIIVRDYLIFLLTNDDFQILKQDSSYTLSPYAASLPTPGGSGTTIDCEGNYIYFASLPSNDKGYIAIVNPGP